jgi:hypothetical protein
MIPPPGNGGFNRPASITARTVRNAKIDTRSARAKLAERREPYWAVISAGCAVCYRKGAKGGTWIARFRDTAGKQHYEALGASADARDPDGRSVYSFAQAQERARDWFRQEAREYAGEAPVDDAEDGPYTVSKALRDHRSDYLHRGGKAVDRLDCSAA